MNQALHIVRKDLRRMRWLLVAWGVVVVVHVLLETVGSTLVFHGLGFQFAIQQLKSGLTLVEALMFVLLVSAIVHDEPLVDRAAFWLTRPIDWRALMGAKLGLAAAVLVAAPLVGQAIVMATFGVGAGGIFRAAPSFVFSSAVWVLLLAAIATLTPSLMRFVVTIAGAVGGMTVFFFLLMIVSVLGEGDENTYDPGMVADPSDALIFFGLLMCAAAAVIVYQYRRRSLGRGVMLAAACLVTVVGATAVWPWQFARVDEPDPGAWARDTTRVHLTTDTTKPPHVSESFSFRRGAPPRKQIAAAVHLVGVPADFSVQSIGVRSRFRLPDNTSLQSAQRGGVNVKRPTDGIATPGRLQAVLGMQVFGWPEEEWDQWPAVLTVSQEDYQRHGRSVGRLTSTLDFFLQRSRMEGSLPLREGAALQHENTRIEIIRVLRHATGCTILVRQSSIQPFLTARRFSQRHFVLRNARRQHAFVARDQYLSNPGFAVGPSFFFGTGELSGGFISNSVVVHYPGSAPPGTVMPEIDAAWLDGADVAVVETSSAGRVTRSVTIEGFRMQASQP